MRSLLRFNPVARRGCFLVFRRGLFDAKDLGIEVPEGLREPEEPTKHAPPPLYQSDAIRLMRSEVKGHFYQATRDISPGEILLQDRPLYSLPFSPLAPVPPASAVESLVIQILNNKPLFQLLFWPHPLRPVMVPQRYATKWTHGHWSVAYAQVKTNSFRAALPGTPEEHALMIYPRITLFNHSCWPNAALQQRPVAKSRESVGEVLAVQHVLKGDEVCISYRPDILLLPASERQARLQSEPWVFTCLCPRCASPRPSDSLLEDTGSPGLPEEKLRALAVDHAKLVAPEREHNLGWMEDALAFLKAYPLPGHHWRRASVRSLLMPYLTHPGWLEVGADKKALTLSLLREELHANRAVLPTWSNAKQPAIEALLAVSAAAGVPEDAARDVLTELEPAWQDIARLYKDKGKEPLILQEDLTEEEEEYTEEECTEEEGEEGGEGPAEGEGEVSGSEQEAASEPEPARSAK